MPVGGGRLPHCGVTTLATRGCGSEFCWKPSRCVPGPHPWVTRCSPGQCGLPRWSSVQSPSSRHPIPERGQTPGRADAPATSCGRRGVLRPPQGCLALQRGLSPVFSCRRGSSDPPGGGIRGTASKSPRITPQRGRRQLRTRRGNGNRGKGTGRGRVRRGHGFARPGQVLPHGGTPQRGPGSPAIALPPAEATKDTPGSSQQGTWIRAVGSPCVTVLSFPSVTVGVRKYRHPCGTRGAWQEGL